MAVSIFPVPRPPLPFSRRYNFPSFVKGPPAPDLSNVGARPCPCVWALSQLRTAVFSLLCKSRSARLVSVASVLRRGNDPLLQKVAVFLLGPDSELTG